MDETTLNWDEFLPALMLAYNTSYTPPLPSLHLSLYLGSDQDYRPYQHQRYNANTTVSLFQLKDYNCCSMHAKLLATMLNNKESNIKTILTNTLPLTISKLIKKSGYLTLQH